MKLFLFVFFLVVYPLSSHSQKAYSRSDILAKNIANLDQSGWAFFSKTENVETYIGFRNELFGLREALPLVIGDVNYDKKDLTQLEQELGLYKLGEKQGLSPSDIVAAEEAITLHWAAIQSVEGQIRSIGFGDTAQAADYREGGWELYKADHKTMLNLVDKKDENLYELLGANDEAYAEIIAPSIKRYTSNMEAVAKAYSSIFLSLPWDSPVDNVEMYTDSSKIYNCFNKNFKSPTTTEVHQQALADTIQGWHTEQGNFGAEFLINKYNNNIFGSLNTVRELEVFKDAPNVVKEKIGSFLRTEFLNNETFIKTEDEEKIRTRTEALIGLKDFNILSVAEENFFNEAFKKEIIVNPFVDYRGYYYSTKRPLPKTVIFSLPSNSPLPAIIIPE